MKQCEDFMLFQVSTYLYWVFKFRDKYLIFALYLLGKKFGDKFFALLWDQYSSWTMSEMVKYKAVSFKKDQIPALYFTMSDIVHKTEWVYW